MYQAAHCTFLLVTGTLLLVGPIRTSEPITTSATSSVQSSAAGSCLEFDGFDDFVIVPRSPTLEPEEITVELWARLDGMQTYNTRLLRKTGHWANGYFIAADQDLDRLMQFMVENGPLVRARDHQSHAAHVGEWHHFAGIYRLESIEFYVDGVLVNEVVHDLGAMDHHPLTDLFIGAGIPSPSPSEFFKGQIDEVRIWNYARAPKSIQRSMHQTFVGAQPGLVGYWKLNEGRGQLARDSSGTKNHGQIGASIRQESSDPSWVPSDAPVCPSGHTLRNS